MHIQPIAPNLYIASSTIVNVFLLDGADGLTLIDTGSPGEAGRILRMVAMLKPQITDLRHIVISHAHPDHIGSLAELKRATKAQVYAHTADRAIIETAKGFRPLTPGPGLVNGIIFRLVSRLGMGAVDGAPVDHTVADGDILPNSLRAVHAPGHDAGQIALLWPLHGGVLFAADACANFLGRLDYSMGYEDLEEGTRSLRKLAQLDFQIACFGHGRVISKQAAEQFRHKWPQD